MRFLLLPALLLSWCACGPPDFDDVSDGIIRGRLFLDTNLYHAREGLPAAGKTVTISYKSDSIDLDNYLFSTKTDAEGHFVFTTLAEHREYSVRYEETIEGKKYAGDTTASTGDDLLPLHASLARRKQTGLIIRAASENLEALGGVSHCLFSNESLAGSSKDCAGSLYQLTADKDGLAGLFGLAAGTYWVRSSIKLAGSSRTVVQSVTINPHEVVDLIVSLPTDPAAPGNELSITVHDTSGAPLAGASICLFRSAALFAQHSCAAANYRLVTNAQGVADTFDLPVVKYFLHGELQVNDTTRWIGQDSLYMQAGRQELTLALRAE